MEQNKSEKVRGCNKLMEIAPKLFAPVIEEAKRTDWNEVKQSDASFKKKLNKIGKKLKTN